MEAAATAVAATKRAGRLGYPSRLAAACRSLAPAGLPVYRGGKNTPVLLQAGCGVWMNVYVSRTDGVGCCSALLTCMVLLRGCVCVVVYSIPFVCKVSLLLHRCTCRIWAHTSLP
jgi:hypothetical protein